MPIIDTRAGNISYCMRGSGPTLVLLHAALHDHHDYDGIATELAQRYRVVAVDWPGCGDSPPPSAPGEITAPLLADGLEDLVHGLGADRVTVVGNSVGGFAAARLAIRQPDRVAGLVLVNTGGFLPRDPITRTLCRTLGTPAVARSALPGFIRLYTRAHNDLIRGVRDRATTRAKTPAGSAMAAALWRSFGTDAHDLRPSSSALQTPTLIVWGSRDTAIPLPLGRATRRYLPHAEFRTMPTGHVPFASAPEDFLALVRPFLDRVAGCGDPDAVSGEVWS